MRAIQFKLRDGAADELQAEVDHERTMDRSDNEEKAPARRRAAAAVVVLILVVLVAVAVRTNERPVEVRAAGDQAATVPQGDVAVPLADDLDSSSTTLSPIQETSTTTAPATSSSTTASTAKPKKTPATSPPASSSTTTTVARPLPPSLLGRIVFAGNRNGVDGIWVMDADGANARNITPTPGHAPDLSPDGRQIVFNSGPGSGDLVIVDSDGSNERTLVRPISVYTPPSWSPDGHRILYAGAGGLRTINPDGTGDRLLLQHQKYQDEFGLSFFGASWAPDGRRLVVTSLGATSADGLWIIDLDTQVPTHVYTGSAHEVAWSPLGDRIAFSGGPNLAIFTVRPDGTDRQQLTGLPGQFDSTVSATDPAWSANGTRIAFTVSRGVDSGEVNRIISVNEVWDIAVDGSGLRNLTNAAGQDRQPTF